MLKAFDYIEFNNNVNVHNENLFQIEMSIAEKIVKNSSLNQSYNKSKCPICNGEKVSNFNEIWKIQYFRCKSCYSIFTLIQEESLKEYINNKELIDFRLSNDYQTDAALRRDIIWENLIDWLKFRTFRYLERNKELDIIDYGNRFYGLIDKISQSNMCNKYELRDSIASKYVSEKIFIEKADIILYLNKLQQSIDPIHDLMKIGESLKDNGLLFLSTRVSTGFDILTLQGNINNVFPYEHVLLLSKEGIEIILKKAGFKVLEISTPGLMDLKYVIENKDGIANNNLFIKYLIENGDNNSLSEFQRFLQKSGMSSFAQVVAQKDV